MLPPSHDLPRKSPGCQRPLPPDAHRPGKQIHPPTPEKLQPPQHHAHHLLRILQRKSNLPPHHLQTQTSRNQLHQPEKDHQDRMAGPERLLQIKKRTLITNKGGHMPPY